MPRPLSVRGSTLKPANENKRPRLWVALVCSAVGWMLVAVAAYGLARIVF